MVGEATMVTGDKVELELENVELEKEYDDTLLE
jgi:hypothetical protein